jgi:predicted enzyme related to lactoylglutathione lyase
MIEVTRSLTSALDLDETIHGILGEGEGWQTRSDAAEIGVHKRGTGPGDTFSLPYLIVDDMAGTLQRVIELDGTVVHPGDDFAICKDSEGSPFGLMAKPH